MSGHLWETIQKHLDDYGVREAEFAQRIGTSPQIVSSWKARGLRTLPDKRLLVGVSDVTRQSYEEVLDALLRDTLYLPKEAGNDERSATTKPAPTIWASRVSDTTNVKKLPSAHALDPAPPHEVAARDEKKPSKTQRARERQEGEGEL
ncbi:hypothetical protein [Janibacter indicus]|uniref:hypothetical protein n=1 Tax=Janibacter indicus TaxID=857417 RepID=UPI003EB81AF3